MKLPNFSYTFLTIIFAILVCTVFVYAKIGNFDGGTIGAWDGPYGVEAKNTVIVPLDNDYNNDMSCDPPPAVGGSSPGGSIGGGAGMGGPA